MGHKNHITEFTENKQIVVHKRRKKYLKKRGEHTTEVREQIQLGLGWTELLLLSPGQASDSFQSAAGSGPDSCALTGS